MTDTTADTPAGNAADATADTASDLVEQALSSTPVFDGHNDLPVALRARSGYSVEGLADGRPDLHTDLPRLRAGRVGAQFWSVYVSSKLPEPEAVVGTLEQIDGVYDSHPRPEVTVAQVADHVDHAREVAGVDHLGLGGDYDGVDHQPTGLTDVSRYPVLLRELADRGWSRADLEALTGRNVLRVLREAEDRATERLWPTAPLR